MWISLALSARGDFGGEPRGSTPKSVYTMLARPFRFPYIRFEVAIFATSRSVVLAFFVVFCTVTYGRVYFYDFYSSRSARRSRRSWNPPLSICFATAQFMKALLGRFV